MANSCGCSVKTIKRNVAEMIDRGWVSMEGTNFRFHTIKRLFSELKHKGFVVGNYIRRSIRIDVSTSVNDVLNFLHALTYEQVSNDMVNGHFRAVKSMIKKRVNSADVAGKVIANYMVCSPATVSRRKKRAQALNVITVKANVKVIKKGIPLDKCNNDRVRGGWFRRGTTLFVRNNDTITLNELPKLKKQKYQKVKRYPKPVVQTLTEMFEDILFKESL